MQHEASFQRLEVVNLPPELRVPLTVTEVQRLADNLGVPVSDMRSVIVTVAPETSLGWRYQRWLHGEQSTVGFNGSEVVGVIMVALPDFLHDYGMEGLQQFERSMFEHGRPGHFTRLTWSAAAQRARG